MEEEKLQAIKKNLMGSLEEEFEDNLDDIDENDLDEFLMNTEEETNAKKVRENKDEKKAASEEESTTENKDNDDPKDKAKNLHEKDADQKIVHSGTPSWTSKGRSITSPQVWYQTSRDLFPIRKSLFFASSHSMCTAQGSSHSISSGSMCRENLSKIEQQQCSVFFKEATNQLLSRFFFC